jgi:hypothetical protein
MPPKLGLVRELDLLCPINGSYYKKKSVKEYRHINKHLLIIFVCPIISRSTIE